MALPSPDTNLAVFRPSDNPRSNSTDKTGLALEFDIETTFRSGGGFVSHDGDATVGVSPELAWVTSSGGRGLVRLSVPLLGAEDPPGTYTVRLHLAQDSENASSSSACDVLLQGEPVLKDVSFQLHAGRVLGLLGRTGSGKTTMTRLLFRLYDVQEGTVEVGGRPVQELRLGGLRQQIGLVT